MSRNKSSHTELEISDNETDKVDSFFHRLFVIQSESLNNYLSVDGFEEEPEMSDTD